MEVVATPPRSTRQRLIGLGVPEDNTQAHANTRIRLTNRLALLLVLTTVSYFPLVNTTGLAALNPILGIGMVVYGLPLLLNHYRAHLAAQLLLSVAPMLVIGGAGLIVGGPGADLTNLQVLILCGVSLPLILLKRQSVWPWLIVSLYLVGILLLPAILAALQSVLGTASYPMAPEATALFLDVSYSVVILVFALVINLLRAEGEQEMRTATEAREQALSMQTKLEAQNQALNQAHADLNRQLQEVRHHEALHAQANQELEARIEELNLRRHTDTLYADFSTRLGLQQRQDIGAWANGLLAYLGKELNLLQLSLYLVDDNMEDNEEDKSTGRQLTLAGGYRLPRTAPEHVKWGQGLLGQTAQNGFPMYLGSEQIRNHHLEAGLYRVAPKAFGFFPVQHNQKVVGVLEVSSFHALEGAFAETFTRFVDALGGALVSMLNQQRIRNLLGEAESRNQRLQSQEEELTQVVEELRQTQEQMEGYQQQLEDMNAQLEDKVDARTQELQATLAELQGTQEQLVLSEKMAALGQLVAGVAHEINSPIGAIKASASTMLTTLPEALAEYPIVLSTLDESEIELFGELVQRSLQESTINLNPREERQLRKQLKAELEGYEIEGARSISTDLVRAGFAAHIEPYLPLLRRENGAQIARMVYNLGQLNVNLENINLAVEKTKKVVYALKSYAHSSDKNERVAISLREHVETVITIYYNQLKYGIDLELDLKEVPEVFVYADELSQVWTNILQNAIQAVKGEGRIAIRVYSTASAVLVEFEDNGPGVPPDIQQRIFEPFFTTKKRGEGTGLGLDICKRIVEEKHQGELSLESVPGQTIFRIRLPLAHNQAGAQLNPPEETADFAAAPATPESVLA